MGSGKSGATVEALKHEKLVIVCPPRVIPSWVKQLAMWGYSGPVTALSQKSTAGRVKALQAAPPTGAIITNYQGFWRDPLFEELRKWAGGNAVVVYDEVHNLKAPGSKQSRRAYVWYKSFKWHVGLTGTLISNGREDVYGQARAINPALFGSNFTHFTNKFLVMGGYEKRQIVGYKNTKEFDALLNEAVVSVEVELDLPETVIETLDVSLDKRTTLVYAGVKENMLAMADEGLITVGNVLTKSIRLRQLASGIFKGDDADRAILIDTSKVEAVVEWAESIRGYPGVIWVNFVLEGESAYEALTKAGFSVSRVFGGKDEYDEWVKGKTNLLIINMVSGAEGLNDMVRARYVLYYSPTFSLRTYQQSFKRTHREGADMSHPVHYTLLQSTDTIEADVYKALEDKKEIADIVYSAIRRI